MQWVKSYCLVPSCLPASALLKRGPEWNSSEYNSTSSKKERNKSRLIIKRAKLVMNLQALINLLQCNVRFVGAKNDFSWLSIPYAWLSIYKSTIAINFSIYEERLVAVEHAMFTFDDLKVNPHNERQTEWQPKYLALIAYASRGKTNNISICWPTKQSNLKMFNFQLFCKNWNYTVFHIQYTLYLLLYTCTYSVQ